MIKESLYFNYDGIDSTVFNIINVNIDNELYKEDFISSAKIRETKTTERQKPYFQGVDFSPLELKLQFYFAEKWNDNLIRQVARWLHQKNYKPLYFSENPEKIYYAMPINNIQMIHSGLKQGYLELTMRCNTYHAYTKEYETQKYDMSENNEDGTMIQLTNYGDLDISPDIWIKKIGNGGLEIINQSNGGAITSFSSGASGQGVLKFTGTVYDGETITIGDKIFEFDTGDGIINEYVDQWISGNRYIDGTIVNKSGILYQCLITNEDKEWEESHWKQLDKSNIKVDVSKDAKPASTKLVFNTTNIEDGDTFSLGNNTYEFDFNDVYQAKNGNIPINIKNYVRQAEGQLITRSNLDFAGSEIKIGDRQYKIMPSSGESIVITNNKGYKGFNDWLLDSYYETDDNFKNIMLLMNEKRDNSLDGIRMPMINYFVNDRIDKKKQILELHKLSKFNNIPDEGDGDSFKFNPIPTEIKGQVVGDELTIFKRDRESFSIDVPHSTNNKFYVRKMGKHSYERLGISNKSMQATVGDIVLVAKRTEFSKDYKYVDYKDKRYISCDFEFLRIKSIKEVSNNELVDRHEDGTIQYEFETPSRLFSKNLFYSIGEGKRIFGTGADLENGKSYLNNLGFVFIDTSKYSQDELKNMISSGDIILGEKGAKKGVSFDISGTIRLGGKDRIETAIKIRDYYWDLRDGINTNQTYFYRMIVFKKQKEKMLILPNLPLTEPYQIRMGNNLDETCENIVKAINEEGKDWVEYSKGTFEHKDVRAEYDKKSKIINLKSKERGNKWNKLVTIVNDWEASQELLSNNYLINQFDLPNLNNGSDAQYCTIDDTNGKFLIDYIIDVLKLNEKNMKITTDKQNIIFINSKKYGTIDNIIPILSNCYACNYYNLQDQPAVTLEGGKDPSLGTIINGLEKAISNSSLNININKDVENNYLTITHNNIGKNTNLNISTTAINTYWTSGKKLYNGRDGLNNNEIINIYGENSSVESNKNKNIIDAYNGKDLILKYGINNILIKGNCFIKFKMRYKLL